MRPILSCCLALVVASAAAHAITYRGATTALITKVWDANPPGEVLFREDFGAGNLDNWKPDQGWSIVDRPEGGGKCARVVSSEKDNEDLVLARHVPITPGHPIVVCWRTRFVSGGEPLHLRVDFFDAEGKTGKPYARQDSSREGQQWTENAMLVSDWFPGYTREITIWFHHNPGANTTSLLSDIRYLLEFDYFRGVKLVHIVPMAFLALVYLAHYGAGEAAEEGRREGPAGRAPDVSGPPRDVVTEVARFLRVKVRAEHVALLVLAAVAGYIYIGRTGNTSGITVTSFELNVRAGLERLLVARPRTKEFLIGHPAMILAAWAALRGYRPFVYLLILAGSIGQVSAVNSFEHLRTPFALSLLRGVNGLVLGCAIGVAAMFVVDPIATWLRDRLGGGRSA